MPDYSLRRNNRYQVAGLVPATFQGSSAEFPVFDYGKVANAYALQENRRLKLAEQKGAIAAAINKLPINERENAWKANYIQNIENQINEYSQSGDYTGAIEKATELANKAVFSPEVTGRVIANQKYEEAKKEVNDRYLSGKISEEVRDWWLETNPYTYEEDIDANGNVIGVKPYDFKQPVNKIDYTNAIKFAASITAPTHRGGSNTTTSLSGLTEGGSSNRTEITEDMLDKAMSGVYNAFPGLQESLLQDMRVDEWLYDKLTKELENETNPLKAEQLQRQIDVVKDRLFDGNIKRTQKEYNSRIINPALHAAAYRHLDTSTVHKEKQTNTVLTGMPTGLTNGGYGPLKAANSGVVNIDWTTQGNTAGQAVLNATEGAEAILSQ